MCFETQDLVTSSIIVYGKLHVTNFRMMTLLLRMPLSLDAGHPRFADGWTSASDTHGKLATRLLFHEIGYFKAFVS